MHLSNQHKALLITLLITGTVVLSVFNLNMKQHSDEVAESYYEIEPEKELTEEETKVLEALEKINNAKPETNKAFNETEDNKHFAQAYKPIAPPEDYTPKPSENEGESENNYTLSEKPTANNKIKKEELSAFSKVNDLLKQQKSKGANTKSTMHYSLVGRTHYYMPTPIYLCEFGGRIVVNITVNAKGDVIDAYINSSSTSDNQCLTEAALEYAKEAKFSEDASKKTQLGSITFNFIGKN